MSRVRSSLRSTPSGTPQRMHTPLSKHQLEKLQNQPPNSIFNPRQSSNKLKEKSDFDPYIFALNNAFALKAYNNGKINQAKGNDIDSLKAESVGSKKESLKSVEIKKNSSAVKRNIQASASFERINSRKATKKNMFSADGHRINEIARKLDMENFHFKPSRPEDTEMVEKAKEERRKHYELIKKPLIRMFTFDDDKPTQLTEKQKQEQHEQLLKKGATRPPQDQIDILRKLIAQGKQNYDKSAPKDNSLQHAALGTSFKSVFLVQGRNKTKMSHNEQFSTLEKTLLYLTERPEARISDAFLEDLYTCTKFAIDPLSAEKRSAIQFEEKAGPRLPQQRSIVGTPNMFNETKKKHKRDAKIAIKMARDARKNAVKARRKQSSGLKRDDHSSSSSDKERGAFQDLQKLNTQKDERQLYDQNMNWLSDHNQRDLSHITKETAGVYPREQSSDSENSCATTVIQDDSSTVIGSERDQINDFAVENSLNKVSEQQDLEDIFDADKDANMSYRQLVLAGKHERTEKNWQKQIEALKGIVKGRREFRMEATKIKTEDLDEKEDLKLLITKSQTTQKIKKTVTRINNTSNEKTVQIPINIMELDESQAQNMAVGKASSASFCRTQNVTPSQFSRPITPVQSNGLYQLTNPNFGQIQNPSTFKGSYANLLSLDNKNNQAVVNSCDNFTITRNASMGNMLSNKLNRPVSSSQNTQLGLTRNTSQKTSQYVRDENCESIKKRQDFFYHNIRDGKSEIYTPSSTRNSQNNLFAVTQSSSALNKLQQEMQAANKRPQTAKNSNNFNNLKFAKIGEFFGVEASDTSFRMTQLKDGFTSHDNLRNVISAGPSPNALAGKSNLKKNTSFNKPSLTKKPSVVFTPQASEIPQSSTKQQQSVNALLAPKEPFSPIYPGRKLGDQKNTNQPRSRNVNLNNTTGLLHSPSSDNSYQDQSGTNESRNNFQAMRRTMFDAFCGETIKKVNSKKHTNVHESGQFMPGLVYVNDLKKAAQLKKQQQQQERQSEMQTK